MIFGCDIKIWQEPRYDARGNTNSQTQHLEAKLAGLDGKALAETLRSLARDVERIAGLRSTDLEMV